MTKIELDLNELLGMDYDEDGEPVGRRDIRGEIVKRAADLLVAEHRREAKQKINERITAAIDSEVTAIVRDALSQPIQRHKPWGDQDGEPTTVLEIAREQLGAYFDKPDNRDSYNRNGTNLAGLITDVVRVALGEEFKPALTEARKAVSERLQDALTKSIATNIVGR